MATTKVYAPNTEFGGKIGPIQFKKGVADVDSDHRLMAYFERKGYGIGKRPKPAELEIVTASGDSKDDEPLDSTTYPDPRTSRRGFGKPLRDAAVDPLPDDYLGPTNAGKAHPHSPLVVSPGLHGVPPKPIKPGDVHVDDVDAQEEAETALAEETLVEGGDVGVAVAEIAEREGTPETKLEAEPKPGTRSARQRKRG